MTKPRDWQNSIGDLATPELVGRAIATYRARMPLRLFPRLFDTWVAAGTGDWAGAALRMPVPAGVQLVGSAGERQVLALGDVLVEVSPAAFDVVSLLADTSWWRFDELPDPIDEPSPNAEICGELVRAGLTEVRLSDDN